MPDSGFKMMFHNTKKKIYTDFVKGVEKIV